jgi:hypothetical protein
VSCATGHAVSPPCGEPAPSAPCGELLPVVRQWTLSSAGSLLPSRSQLWLLPFRGSEGVFLNPLDPRALRTLEELRSPGRVGAVRAVLHFAGAFARALRRPDTLRQRLLSDDPFSSGTVALLRSQKLIVVDPERRLVVKLPRSDEAEPARLLRCEAEAAEILPGHTLPTVCARLDEEPRFLAQPYVRSLPRPCWRDVLPDFGAVMEILCRYYAHFGLEAVPARTHVDGLLELCAEGIRSRGLDAIVRALCSRIDRELGATDAVLAVTRVHGDLIASHITWPVEPARPAPLIVDWSESHRYSAFHDLFYFQFQNHTTDLWDRWGDLDEGVLPDYFGAGCDVLWEFLEERGIARRSLAAFRLNLLVGFLQELDHRLNRLHPRYLGFWVQQAERLLAAAARAGR